MIVHRCTASWYPIINLFFLPFFPWSNCVGYRPKNTHAGFAIV